MLSAFTARPIVELKQRDKSKIESLLAYGDRLLVGLHTGSLRIYRVNEPSDEPGENGDANGDAASKSPAKPRHVDLLREEDKFSRKPIQQLAIIKEANILVSLSDGYVSIHDLQSYQLVERLERTKGASSFAVTSNVVKDPDTGVPSLVSRLAVAVKRKLVLWTWQDMELTSETQEISLEASIKSLTWASGTKMVAGMDPGFSMVDIETQEVAAINRPGTAGQAGDRFAAVSSSGMGYMGMGSWVPKPMATRLADGQLLLAKDVNTLFTNDHGEALEKRQIPWHAAPEAIGYSYPYMLALQQPSTGALQVRNPDSLSLLQTISLPNASFLHVPQPNISLAHAGKGFLVASDRCIWRMGAIEYESQIDQLVEKTRFDEAISLLGMLEDTLLKDKSGRIREIKMQKAQGLLSLRKYRDALDLFTEAEAPPERVIALYPRSIAGDLSSIADASEPSETDQTTEDGDAKVDDSAKEPPSMPQKTMLGKFKGSHKRNDSDTASVRSVPRADTDNASLRPTPSKADEKSLEGNDLKAAVMALCSFLAQARQWIQRCINFDGTMKDNPPHTSINSETDKPAFAALIPQDRQHEDADWRAELLNTAQLVDTTLFRAYMLALPSLAGPLFRLDNFCDPKVVDDALYETGRYVDLIDFLRGKKLHREALELLAKFGKEEAQEEVMPELRGPNRTVGYLQQLPPELIDIVLEFAEWPIREKPDVGMEIFLADTYSAESLPRDRVLDFLTGIDTNLTIRYLEHIILELNDQSPDFHQQLIDLYLDKLKAHDYSDDAEHMDVRQKLESLLGKSTQYNKGKTFRLLPADNPDFFESRALVLSAMGSHKQALAIYVFQLKDYEKAEDYCNRVYLNNSQPCLVDATTMHEKPFVPFDPEDSPQPNIYTTLLGLYLKPPPNEEKRWPQALDLLSNHGARLPASSTLDLMPDDLAVRELERYFLGRIRNATSILREEKIVRALEGVRKVGIERTLLVGPGAAGQGKSRKVTIREEDHCKVCHKRFGASAIRVYPDNEVVHYGCVGRSGVKRAGAADLRGMRKGTAWG